MIDHPQQFTNSSHDSMAVSNTVYPKMDQHAWLILKKMENPNRKWMMTGGAKKNQETLHVLATASNAFHQYGL